MTESTPNQPQAQASAPPKIIDAALSISVQNVVRGACDVHGKMHFDEVIRKEWAYSEEKRHGKDYLRAKIGNLKRQSEEMTQKFDDALAIIDQYERDATTDHKKWLVQVVNGNRKREPANVSLFRENKKKSLDSFFQSIPEEHKVVFRAVCCYLRYYDPTFELAENPSSTSFTALMKQYIKWVEKVGLSDELESVTADNTQILVPLMRELNALAAEAETEKKNAEKREMIDAKKRKTN